MNSPLQEQAEYGRAAHQTIGDPQDENVLVEHETDDLHPAPDRAVDPPVVRRQPEQHQGHAQPEEREESMERRLRTLRVLTIKRRELPGENQIAKLGPKLWLVDIDAILEALPQDLPELSLICREEVLAGLFRLFQPY